MCDDQDPRTDSSSDDQDASGAASGAPSAAASGAPCGAASGAHCHCRACQSKGKGEDKGEGKRNVAKGKATSK